VREQNYPERATSVRKTLRVSRPARNTRDDLAESTGPIGQPWAQRSPEPHGRDHLDDEDASQGQACESVAAPEPSLIGIIRHRHQATHISPPPGPRTQSASAIETVCVYRKAFGLGCVSKRARSQVATCPSRAAIRMAIEVRNSMVERNAGLPPDRRIEFRIGIHLGNIVEGA